jgi:hypothetical protein
VAHAIARGVRDVVAHRLVRTTAAIHFPRWFGESEGMKRMDTREHGQPCRTSALQGLGEIRGVRKNAWTVRELGLSQAILRRSGESKNIVRLSGVRGSRTSSASRGAETDVIASGPSRGAQPRRTRGWKKSSNSVEAKAGPCFASL